MRNVIIVAVAVLSFAAVTVEAVAQTTANQSNGDDSLTVQIFKQRFQAGQPIMAKRQIELHSFRTDIGLNGFPIDPNHSFNRARFREELLSCRFTLSSGTSDISAPQEDTHGMG